MRHIKEYNQLFENQQELTQEQKDWLDKCVDKGSFSSWKLNPQTGLVDVDGSFDCSGQSLTDLKGVRFGDVVGDFNCRRNQLTSLKGAPQKVNGYFYCEKNQLTSLEGVPQEVDGYFYFSGNPISEDAIMDIIQTMNDRGITLEEAVSECWSDLEDEDKLYLAKHNPDLSPEEKGGYQALERHKKRLI